jgi:hypothetical protein
MWERSSQVNGLNNFSDVCFFPITIPVKVQSVALPGNMMQLLPAPGHRNTDTLRPLATKYDPV